jgi:hypothetical protein
MPNISLRKTIVFIVDLPEYLLLAVFVVIRRYVLPGGGSRNKIKSLSQNAGIIESKHKGLRVISIEVMDGFAVYHGVHKKQIKQESLERIREEISEKLANKNVFVSLDRGDPKMLKVVIQN